MAPHEPRMWSCTLDTLLASQKNVVYMSTSISWAELHSQVDLLQPVFRLRGLEEVYCSSEQ